jgi:hypothetical protein
MLAVFLAGCASSAAPQSHRHKMAPLDQMPDYVSSAPVRVQEAYQFAVANPEIASQVACYCGCRAMGHTSNYSCYVQSTDASGAPVFDNHAVGCSICDDITHDTMTLLDQGKSVKEIHDYVDQTYSKYGPSTGP